jgi:hypothetical protein
VQTFVLLRQAEEVERQCMARSVSSLSPLIVSREERIVRANIREEFQQLEKPFLEDQVIFYSICLKSFKRYFEREFSNLIQKIREPPSILARARFLMGSPMQGGGNVTMCEVD